MKTRQLKDALGKLGIPTPRYICHDMVSDTWYAIVIGLENEKGEQECSAVIELPEDVEDAQYVVHLHHVDDCWEFSDNYSISLVMSVSRQLARCASDCVIICENIMAMRHKNKTIMTWAKGILDTSKVLPFVHSIDDLSTKDLIWDKTVLLASLLRLLRRDWLDDVLNSKRDKVLERLKYRDNLSKMIERQLQKDKREHDLLTGERLLFDTRYFALLQKHMMQTIDSLTTQTI